jgi:hypothetical protein
VSAKREWQRFAERRRRGLRGAYPCAVPTYRSVCPKHGIRVPQTVQLPEGFVERPDGSWRHVAAQILHLSGICRACRDELYEQLPPSTSTTARR